MIITMFPHATTLNHGCEAIIVTTSNILKSVDRELYLISSRSEDKEYTTLLEKTCRIKYVEQNQTKRFSIRWFAQKLCRVLVSPMYFYYLCAKETFKLMPKSDVYLSIGGDNYCYGGPSSLYGIDHCAKNAQKKLVLWGASIEPEMINKTMAQDLNSFDLIIARESLTYNALIKKTTAPHICLYPDPAFTLESVSLDMPIGFHCNNTIGINMSPLIANYETKNGATMNNYKALLKHIITTTDMQIALIPHVCISGCDDLVPLSELYAEFQSTGRVVIIDNHNCEELKGYISNCRMFIGARTHATIAAYSTCVPTLVVGYSIKSKGIATDIFGTYENYVIPVQALENENDLIISFEWLRAHEKEIRNHLSEFMPGYIEKAWQAGDEIRKLMDQCES